MCLICDIAEKKLKVTRWLVPGEYQTDNRLFQDDFYSFHVILDKPPYPDPETDLCVLTFFDKHIVANTDEDMSLIHRVAYPFVNKLCEEEGYHISKVDRNLGTEPSHNHLQFCLKKND